MAASTASAGPILESGSDALSGKDAGLAQEGAPNGRVSHLLAHRPAVEAGATRVPSACPTIRNCA
jgi:hypothetical protein